MSWPTFWLKADWRSTLLKPLSWLVCREATRRLQRFRLNPPISPGLVILVGNIVVGGTGKTPFIVWLVQRLVHRGYNVGVIASGYGGQAKTWPQQVNADSDATLVGDEPVLLARALGCPVIASPKRAEAMAMMFKHHHLDIVISDDGLQHYALARDIELIMLDATRPNQGLGNGLCLPAGPLREPASRLSEVDFVIFNGERPAELDFNAPCVGQMQLQPVRFVNLLNPRIEYDLGAFSGQQGYAVAGIGHPERFYSTLKSLSIQPLPLDFSDHHAFSASDFNTLDTKKPLFMTTKDAVKCNLFAKDNWWVLEINPICDCAFENALMLKVRQAVNAKKSKN